MFRFLLFTLTLLQLSPTIAFASTRRLLPQGASGYGSTGNIQRQHIPGAGLRDPSPPSTPSPKSPRHDSTLPNSSGDEAGPLLSAGSPRSTGSTTSSGSIGQHPLIDWLRKSKKNRVLVQEISPDDVWSCCRNITSITHMPLELKRTTKHRWNPFRKTITKEKLFFDGVPMKSFNREDRFVGATVDLAPLSGETLILLPQGDDMIIAWKHKKLIPDGHTAPYQEVPTLDLFKVTKEDLNQTNIDLLKAPLEGRSRQGLHDLITQDQPFQNAFRRLMAGYWDQPVDALEALLRRKGEWHVPDGPTLKFHYTNPHIRKKSGWFGSNDIRISEGGTELSYLEKGEQKRFRISVDEEAHAAAGASRKPNFVVKVEPAESSIQE